MHCCQMNLKLCNVIWGLLTWKGHAKTNFQLPVWKTLLFRRLRDTFFLGLWLITMWPPQQINFVIPQGDTVVQIQINHLRNLFGHILLVYWKLKHKEEFLKWLWFPSLVLLNFSFVSAKNGRNLKKGERMRWTISQFCIEVCSLPYTITVLTEKLQASK